MKILVENIRSLCGEHRITLRPLTLLVGENSTGKSTFLAIVSHIFTRGFPAYRPSFNTPPFDLGSFDSIATFKGGKYGRADFFSVGFILEGKEKDFFVRASYSSHVGQPQLSGFELRSKRSRLTLSPNPEGKAAILTLQLPGMKKTELPLDTTKLSSISSDVPLPFALERVILEAVRKLPRAKFVTLDRLLMILYSRLTQVSTVALAPVRTKPRRTYDQISDEFKPEGDHIPVVLARIWGQKGESESSLLADQLGRFGKASSLFREIRVKRLGKRPSDPFQLFVSTAGPAANLSDVGYGVSQALPVIVQSVLAGKERRVLLQQPEVHLHPKAQAALGTFFARLVAERKHELVVETHSDYLVDRVRLEVAQGKISANDVIILHFEKLGLETNVHEISIDKNGNVINAPESYRRFFIDEETRLLKRTAR